MAVVEQLRYVRLGTRDLAHAINFARRILGLQLVEEGDGAASFRSDFRDHTLVYFDGDPAEQAVGFEVYGEAGLAAAVTALSDHGIAAVRGDAAACAKRKVRAMASFHDPAGNVIELVVRPLNSGWRYFASRDAGVTGLAGVALRAPAPETCEQLWTGRLGARVSDRVGESTYLRLDEAHHRLAYLTSVRPGVLAIEYGVENVDLLMQNSYFLQGAQVRIVHGPGRRPASGQLFLTFAGPDGVLYSFVAEGVRIEDETKHRPRQFPPAALSFCSWGSESDVAEFCADPQVD